jgi:glycosyltransferase involved in cell wall biosynthesis
MRLGIDAGNFARDRRGMGRVARDIATAALADPSFTVTFLLERSRDEGALRAAFSDHALDVAPASSARTRSRYDLVWFPWNGMRFTALAPTVVTINDAFAFTYAPRGLVARLREQHPIRRGARHGTRLVTCSHWSRRDIARALRIDSARLTVIPYAPNPFFVPGSDPSPFPDARYVLLVGAREARKNARLAIEACGGAFRDTTDLLAIVGDLTEADRALLRAKNVRHATLSGVDDPALRALYRNARAVLVPSLAEGFGLVAVEAMACGAPTIAANVSALPEAAQGGALLLDPYDVAAWRGAIDRTLHDDGFAGELAARGAAIFAGADRSAPSRAYLSLFAETTAG